MNTTQEITYLLELAGLCDLMLLHADRIEAAAATWHELEAAARESVRHSIHEAGTGGARGVTDSVVEMTHLQGQIWVALDGFLASWARASLFMWPAPAKHRTDEQKKATWERGAYLRQFLEVEDKHTLNDRDLRNDWMHYDERLDDALALYGRVTPQRFLREGEREPDSAITMRLFDLTNLYVLFANERSYSLRALFEAVRDLKGRVQKAMDSLPMRRRAELLADSY